MLAVVRLHVRATASPQSPWCDPKLGVSRNDASVYLQVFAEVAAAMRGEAAPPRPRLRDAVREMQEHAHGLAEWKGNERKAVLQMRKFVRLYLHGFQSSGELNSTLMQCQDLAAWDRALQACPYDLDECASRASDVTPRLKRGQHGATTRVVLPDGWLDPDYDVSNISDVACEG